jgi:hypothetical protein
MTKPKQFKVKLINTNYVKGQPGIEKTTLTVEGPDKETARANALAFAKKNFGAGYELVS